MIPRKQRLPIKEFSGKTKIRSNCFLVKISPNSLGYPRFGIIVGTKTVPRSTRRHYLKRIIYESIKNWKLISEDFLFILSPAANNIKTEDLKKELKILKQEL